MASRCMIGRQRFPFMAQDLDVQFAVYRRDQLYSGGEEVPIAAGTDLGRYEML
jgi:hypothetical protein